MREVQKSLGDDKVAVLLLDNSHQKNKKLKRFRKKAEKFFAETKLDLPWQRVLVPGGSDTIHKTFNKSGYGLILVDPSGRVLSTSIHGRQLGFVLNKTTVVPPAKGTSAPTKVEVNKASHSPRVKVGSPVRRKDGTWEISVQLSIPIGWHVYGSKEESGEPTTLSMKDTGGLRLVGVEVPEGKKIEKNGLLSYHLEGQVELKAILASLPTKKNETKHQVRGLVRFMMCDEKRCLPPAELAWQAEIKTGKNALD